MNLPAERNNAQTQEGKGNILFRSSKFFRNKTHTTIEESYAENDKKEIIIIPPPNVVPAADVHFKRPENANPSPIIVRCWHVFQDMHRTGKKENQEKPFCMVIGFLGFYKCTLEPWHHNKERGQEEHRNEGVEKSMMRIPHLATINFFACMVKVKPMADCRIKF